MGISRKTCSDAPAFGTLWEGFWVGITSVVRRGSVLEPSPGALAQLEPDQELLLFREKVARTSTLAAGMVKRYWPLPRESGFKTLPSALMTRSISSS